VNGRGRREGSASSIYAHNCTYINLVHGSGKPAPGTCCRLHRRRSFPEPERTLAERSLPLPGDGSSAAKIHALVRLRCGSTIFQRLARRLNGLREDGPVELRSTDSRGRLSPHKPLCAVPHKTAWRRRQFSLPKGVTPFISSSYNDLVMSTVRDAAQQIQFASAQFASARMLAALFSVPTALSGESAFATASQSVR
jgi:hypothetical protein